MWVGFLGGDDVRAMSLIDRLIDSLMLITVRGLYGYVI